MTKQAKPAAAASHTHQVETASNSVGAGEGGVVGTSTQQTAPAGNKDEQPVAMAASTGVSVQRRAEPRHAPLRRLALQAASTQQTRLAARGARQKQRAEASAAAKRTRLARLAAGGALRDGDAHADAAVGFARSAQADKGARLSAHERETERQTNEQREQTKTHPSLVCL